MSLRDNFPDFLRKELIMKVLDNLTPENFKTSAEQIKELTFDTKQKLEELAHLIFEKAIAEPSSCVPYANMCKQLELIKVPLDDGQKRVIFRTLLLTKCQREFEQDKSSEKKREDKITTMKAAKDDKEKFKGLELELEEEAKTMKMRQLGNIRFIGELFKVNMLVDFIIHGCIKKLFARGDEESLECVCCLLEIVGKDLDLIASRSRGSNLMDSHFLAMQRIVDGRLTSSKVKFMLQDVIDLRKNNWIPKRDEINPKPIDQIHKEAEKEALGAQLHYQHINYPTYFSDDRRKISENDEFKQKNRGVFIEQSTQTTGEIGFEKLKQDFKDILLNGNISDVILKVGGQEIKAHRCILAARSPVFLAMMMHEMKENASGVVDIPDVDLKTFADFLNYLYTGSVENMTSDNAVKLYTTADKYQVNELKSICMDHMLANISLDNFCDLLTLSLQHDEKDLKDSCIHFFTKNSLDIALTVKWQTFLSENPIIGNELFIKHLQLSK